MTIAYKEIGFKDGVCAQNNVIYYLKKHAEDYPNRIVLKWVSDSSRLNMGEQINTDLPHNSITTFEFYENIKKISQGLKESGIEKGDRVIIFIPMSVELYQCMFAVQNIGAIAVFLESWARYSHLGASVKVASPKAIISIEKAYELFSNVKELEEIPTRIVVGPHKQKYNYSLQDLLCYPPCEEITPVDAHHSALITFTTGSSGVPKGANRTHQFLSAQHIALDESIPYKDSDIDLPAFPVFSLNNIAAGVTTVIPGTEISMPTPKDPIVLISQILSNKVNCATLSLSMIVGISDYCKNNNLKLEGLTRVVTGGAPVSNDNIRALLSIAPNTKLMILYGSTEAEPIAHIEAHEILAHQKREGIKNDDEQEGVNVGYFAEGLEHKFIRIYKERIELKNDDWKPWEVSTGDVGELVVSGLHVCRSYFNNEKATLDTKIFESNGKVWHRTGDLAYIDKEKHVWIVGRVHNVIFRDNQPLFPVRAEILLQSIPFVDKSAYLGFPDEKLGEKTYAIVSLKNDNNEKGEVEDLIRQTLESKSIPVDEIRVLPEIPMDPRHHSKVEYSILKEKIENGEI